MNSECESCGFSIETKEYTYGFDNKKMQLCFLCAGTFAGNAAQYPSQYDNADVLKCICFVGNAILKAISEPKEEKNEPKIP